MTTTKAKAEKAKTVTVGLKSPNGLILRLFAMEERVENTPSGPRTFKMSAPNLEAGTVTLKGYGGAAFGIKQDHRIVGQYALTTNVDSDFMHEWLKQNKDSEIVKNNLIFIHAEEASAVDQGKDQKAIWDGMHPLRMHATTKDPRVPKKVRTMTKKDDDDGETLSAPDGQRSAA